MSNTDKIAERTAKLSDAKRAMIEKRLRGERVQAGPPQLIRRRSGQEPAVLSFAQQRLWFIDRLEAGSAFYNNPVAVRLSGRLRRAALERTLSEVVRRHEVLRAHFAEVDGRPVQVISPAAPVGLLLVDLGALPEAEREAAAARLAAEEAGTAFDLSRGPLYRARLLRMAAEEHIVLLTFHHIVTDGWSNGVLVREVAALYEAFSSGLPSPLADLEIQYADYAAWQREWLRGAALEEQLNYWRRQLAGAGEPLELPTDRPRPVVQSFRGARHSAALEPELVEALRRLSRGEGATLFMTLLAAFQALLSRYTAREDVAVGTAIAGRTRREVEGLIGFFANTLVLRTDLSGDPSFRALLGRVREVSLGAYAHQDLPFEKVVEAVSPERSLSHSPLFQIAFGVHNAPVTTLELPGLSLSPVSSSNEVGKFDLTVWAVETPAGMQVRWNYNTDLFDATTVERMHNHYETLLASILADPDAQLSTLNILTDAEKAEQALKEEALAQSAYRKFLGVKSKPVSLPNPVPAGPESQPGGS